MRKQILFNQVKWFRLPILLIVFSSLCTSSSFSQSITWLGGPNPQDTLASTPSFWSTGVLPTSTSDIIIPDGAPPLFIDVDITCASVTFQGGSTATHMLVGDVTLTITGNITIEAATAPRGVIILGTLTCAAIVGGINTGPLPGNVIIIFDNIDLIVPGDVTGCNLAMFGNSSAAFGGNFTGGQVYAPFVSSPPPYIEFNSTDPQIVPAGIYARLYFKGGGDKTLAGPVTVTSEASFNAGIVINSSLSTIFFDGSLGSTAANGGSALSFVTGPVRWSRLSAGDFTFPVGNLAAGYHPVTITPTSLGAADFTVEYIRSSAAALGTITAPTVLGVSQCEYWNISRTSGGDADVTLTWNANSGCGGPYITDPPTVTAVHFNGTNWDASGGIGTGIASNGSVTWTGVTTFSPFTLGTTSLLNPLPVKFGSIKAYEKQKGIQLDWKVYSENKVRNYEVERSADARTFTSVGSLPALYNNTSDGDYGFFDANPLPGTSYYRIKNNDLDGKSAYSIVIRVNRNKTIKGLSLYPNPVMNGIVLLQGSDLGRGNYKINIFGSNGQEIYKQQIKHNGGTIAQTIELPSTISKGVYMLSVKDENGNIIFKEKLVRQ